VGRDRDRLLAAAADQALYIAKNEGRNRHAIYQPDPEPDPLRRTGVTMISSGMRHYLSKYLGIVARLLLTALGAAAMVAIAAADPLPDFDAVARAAGTPNIPGLMMIWLAPWGDPAQAPWRNIIVHQTEGPAGSARAGALELAKNPTRRGVMVWVETDGTVYWAAPETAIPTHGDGANRNDNKYIDNRATFHQVIKTNSIGVEFAGNFPDVAKPANKAQIAAWRILVRLLRARYGIAAERVYAHNWIDYKDARYCEGCDLATLARQQGF
jgi:hypothetical protein